MKLFNCYKNLSVLWMAIGSLSLSSTGSLAEDWPQWRGPSRDGTWQEADIIDKLPEGQLPYVWSPQIGPGSSGPTGAVYFKPLTLPTNRDVEVTVGGVCSYTQY